jgi:membrane-associated phospholipid phosphatase
LAVDCVAPLGEEITMPNAQIATYAKTQTRLSDIFVILKKHAFPGLWLWGLTAFLALVSIVFISLNPRLTLFVDSRISLLLLSMGIIPILLRRISEEHSSHNTLTHRFMTCGMMIFYILPTLYVLAIFNDIIMTLPMPFADRMLADWDQILGFDWRGYAVAVAHFDMISITMDKVYHFHLFALLLIGLEAVIVGDYYRCKELMALTVTSAVFVTIVGSFFPCVGAMDFHAGAELKALFPPNTGNSWVGQLSEMRSTRPVSIDPNNLTGLSAFPSFHTLSGILLVYGSRGKTLRFSLAAVFSTIMIAATPVFGGHYFVDVISGALLAAIFISMGRGLMHRKEA